ncbi:MAG: 2-oxo-3-hexenedioate decarboxylase [Myxococcales bacterium]|nr:2-oxo-3-hexenedioate decarboxylase [Myxococcales bacterium]MCB9647300.1 2-oxo-3-hexenedioate decarboxylase [Deltaproteobacteria bacterium]
MTVSDADVARLAAHVHKAQLDAQAIPKLTNEHPDLSVEDGYRVQVALQRRYLEAGHRLVGWKAGLTSQAKMRQMGVSEPSVGFLTDRMAVPEGTVVETSTMVHPRVECEVAFVLGADLPAKGCTVEDVLAATAYVVPAIEIIDSRYEAFKFDLPSVIADNSSSARFVVGGNPTRLETVDRTTLGLAMVKNGELLTTGASAAVMGDPAAAVALTANLVGRLGQQLRRGMIILSGGITAAFPVAPGDHVSARFQSLGVVDVRFA